MQKFRYFQYYMWSFYGTHIWLKHYIESSAGWFVVCNYSAISHNMTCFNIRFFDRWNVQCNKCCKRKQNIFTSKDNKRRKAKLWDPMMPYSKRQVYLHKLRKSKSITLCPAFPYLWFSFMALLTLLFFQFCSVLLNNGHESSSTKHSPSS